MGNSYDRLEKRLDEHQTAAEIHMARIEAMMAEKELERANERVVSKLEDQAFSAEAESNNHLFNAISKQ